MRIYVYPLLRSAKLIPWNVEIVSPDAVQQQWGTKEFLNPWNPPSVLDTLKPFEDIIFARLTPELTHFLLTKLEKLTRPGGTLSEETMTSFADAKFREFYPVIEEFPSGYPSRYRGRQPYHDGRPWATNTTEKLLRQYQSTVRRIRGVVTQNHIECTSDEANAPYGFSCSTDAFIGTRLENISFDSNHPVNGNVYLIDDSDGDGRPSNGDVILSHADAAEGARSGTFEIDLSRIADRSLIYGPDVRTQTNTARKFWIFEKGLSGWQHVPLKSVMVQTKNPSTGEIATSSADFSFASGNTSAPSWSGISFQNAPAATNITAGSKVRVLELPDFVEKTDEKAYAIRSGTYQARQPVVLPVGASLLIEAGTTIELAPTAYFYVSGKMTVNGTTGRPVTFTRLDGEDKSGAVIVNSPSKEKSTFNNCVFEHSSDRTINGVIHHGALTILGSTVDINQCSFNNIKAEDAINAKDSLVHIYNSTFYNIFSDAIDYDFSFGSIQDSRFTRIGNDAIDLGEASPLIKNCVVHTAGDKGISIGGRSFPRIEGCDINGADVGIQVKDDSRPDIIQSKMSTSRIGVHIHRKHENRDSMRAYLYDVEFDQNEHDIFVDPGAPQRAVQTCNAIDATSGWSLRNEELRKNRAKIPCTPG